MLSHPGFFASILLLRQILQNISKPLVALLEILNGSHDLLECALFAGILQLLGQIGELVGMSGIVIDHVVHQRAQLSHRRIAVLVVMMVMTMLVVVMMMLVTVVMVMVVVMLMTMLMEMVMGMRMVMVVGMTVGVLMGVGVTIVSMLMVVVVRMFMAVSAVVFVTHSI